MFDEFHNRTWQPGGDISAEQTEFATNLRIPFLSTAAPRWNYITGIVVGEDFPDHGIVPTEDEVREIAAQLQSYCTFYRPGFREAMARFAPYDIDSTANLGYYLKRPDGGWCYRKRTWESPPWWPPRETSHALSEVLARNFAGWSSTSAP